MNRTRRIVISCVIGVCAMLAWVGLATPASAHPAIERQIQDLTGQIETAPNDANLYLRRGELHRIHRDWEQAEADYETSLRLDPHLAIAKYCLGRMKLEAGDSASAKAFLDKYLEQRPTDPEALAARARASTALGQYLAAAGDFTGAIDHSPGDSPRPEYFLERARALEAAGPDHIDEALTGLDSGVDRLGEVITLQLYAVDLELARRNYDGALRRLDRISAGSVRQEPWLVRKATILEAAGRTEDARVAYQQTLTSIDELPSSRRNNKAVTRLENEAREALKRLESDNSPD